MNSQTIDNPKPKKDSTNNRSGQVHTYRSNSKRRNRLGDT